MILAFGHQSRVGKDTAARFAVQALEELGIPTVRRAFAEPLKAVCYFLYGHAGLLNADFYDTVPGARTVEVPLLGKTPVDTWIDVGQALRGVHPDTWVGWTMDKADRAWEEHQIVSVISDLRFVNEARAITVRGGWCVKVEREEGQVLRSDQGIPADYPWESVIKNDGSARELRQKVRALVADFAKGVLRAGDR